MAGCSADIQRRTLKQSRIFLLTPDPQGCGLKDNFYGRECQLMELDNATKEISGSVTPYYAWNRYTGELCFVGQTEATPDIPTPNLRFYELCEPGIPVPWTLGRCMVVVAINHGLCKSAGSLMNGWSQYAEIYGLVPTSINGGRRASYNGEDDEVSVEVATRQVFMYQVGPMDFTAIDLTSTLCVTAANMTFNDAVFNCNVGCGGVDCGCVQTCDDGTQSFYIPAACTAATNNMLAYSIDGGETVNHVLLPAATGVGVITPYPKVAIANGSIYVMAYQAPPELVAAPLDEYGSPGAWSTLAILSDALGAVITGLPGAMVADGDNVHMLVVDATGARFYTQSNTLNASDGPRTTFPALASISAMAACGGEVVVGGAGGALYRSVDQGRTFTLMTGPVGVVAAVESIAINDAYIWVTYDLGLKYYTVDGGATWRQLVIPGQVNDINSIHFVNSSMGWMVGADGIYNTWFGGTRANHWTNQAPRIGNVPAGFIAGAIAVPPCAPEWLKTNTVMLVGSNSITGDDQVVIGRTKISGI